MCHGHVRAPQNLHYTRNDCSNSTPDKSSASVVCWVPVEGVGGHECCLYHRILLSSLGAQLLNLLPGGTHKIVAKATRCSLVSPLLWSPCTQPIQQSCPRVLVLHTVGSLYRLLRCKASVLCLMHADGICSDNKLLTIERSAATTPLSASKEPNITSLTHARRRGAAVHCKPAMLRANVLVPRMMSQTNNEAGGAMFGYPRNQSSSLCPFWFARDGQHNDTNYLRQQGGEVCGVVERRSFCAKRGAQTEVGKGPPSFARSEWEA